MTRMTMKCLLVLCLAVRLQCSSVEPEPGILYTTTFENEPAPAPAASSSEQSTSAPVTSSSAPVTSSSAPASSSVPVTSTSAPVATSGTAGSTTAQVAASTTAQATTTTPLTYTVVVSIALTNISSITSEASFIEKLESGMKSAANSASVVVQLHFINVQTLYEITQLNVNQLIEAVSQMSGVATSLITVNNQTYSGGRRLLEDAQVTTKVLNTDSVDCVAEAQRIMSASSPSELLTQLQDIDASAYASVTLTQPNAPLVTFSATTIVTGTVVPPAMADVQAQVEAVIGGTVTVSVTSSSSSAATSSAAPGGNGFEGGDEYEDNYAPTVAPMITIWAAVFAFALS